MLEKTMYDSWASRIHLFIKGNKHDRMMLDSIDNDPLVYPNVEEDRKTRLKKYSKLTKAQQLQDDCDVQATNIIIHGLSPNVEIATTSKGNYVAGQPRVIKCYNCQGEGHMARQCTQLKRPRNVAWFKEKLMLAEAQEAGQILDEEQLAFLADLGIDEAL
nr:retrovirus-related Pol polyprotein from transposon TNT 1-94 [Tanacetum cinerariifolium]